MIIKQPDDRSGDLLILQSLLDHPKADAATRKRITEEIRNIKAGLRGEEEAAYEMQVQYGQSKNWMIIHDLRIEHEGLVAQIDHLLINRVLEFWVCESKHFSEGIAINEHGEFSAFYRSKPSGVPSPIAQNLRHILVLKRLVTSGVVNLPTRLGMTLKPDYRSLVLVSKRARISRPATPVDGLECVIKNDQLMQTIDKRMDEANPLTFLSRVLASDTIEVLAREVAALHKPLSMDWHAKFGLPSPESSSMSERAQVQQAVKASVSELIENSTETELDLKTSIEGSPRKERKKLVCDFCEDAVSYSVAKFCWFNKPRFGGKIYCMDCQKQVEKQLEQ